MSSTSKQTHALGLDFGTESVRALVVNVQTGEEAAQAIVPYTHGVITERLPGSDAPLPADFALQHPMDYLENATAAIRQVLESVPARQIIGIGVDFTACTVLPVRKDGTPLMFLPQFQKEPHAWVKLWKHHGAQWEADRLNTVAKERKEKFLDYYGGATSCEWFLPKCWETLRKAPEVYDAADLFMDAGDWFVQQMTGAFTRSTCTAGYKGLWNDTQGFPSRDFLGALDPQLAGLEKKWVTEMCAPGQKAGGVSESFATRSGLVAGTPVSAATIDAHSGVAGMGVYQEGSLSVIMGTSSCHMVLSRELHLFEGFAGVAKDGILPGFYGYESGQAAVGDLFAWFNGKILGRDSFDELSRKAMRINPGTSGVLALDWWNGNRSVLMDPELTGVLMGLQLSTPPEAIYRALVEASAFGTRKIADSYREAGISLNQLVVTGGLTRDPFILQTYADVLGLPVRVAPSSQAVALGAAIFGALAAGQKNGGYDVIEDAIVHMTQPISQVHEPQPEAVKIYNDLYKIYGQAHDLMGRQQTLLKNLKQFSMEVQNHKEKTGE